MKSLVDKRWQTIGCRMRFALKRRQELTVLLSNERKIILYKKSKCFSCFCVELRRSTIERWKSKWRERSKQVLGESDRRNDGRRCSIRCSKIHWNEENGRRSAEDSLIRSKLWFVFVWAPVSRSTDWCYEKLNSFSLSELEFLAPTTKEREDSLIFAWDDDRTWKRGRDWLNNCLAERWTWW